ncbi:MAG: FG-GAP repeat protein, partial [Balneolales bacterium]|nr:FG-GAP repeat protein [Balneolales bacterium]
MKTIKTLSILLLLSAYAMPGYGQTFIESEQPEAIENQLFGFSISVSDWMAVATAPQKDIGNRKSIGSAFFYKRTEDGWEIEQEVTPSGLPSFSNFGLSSKISGQSAFIGSLGSENGILMEESVFVYEYNDTAWTHTQTLRPTDAKLGSRFGTALDMEFNLSVVGAYQADGNESKSGAAYVFEYDGEAWVQTAKLSADDGESNDFFGHAVLILDNQFIAVGAYNASGANERSGAVYIFEQDNDGNWNQVAKLFDSNGTSGDLFGYSLATQVDVAILTKTTNHTFWRTLFIGAPGSNDIDDIQTGSVYFSNLRDDQWFLSFEMFGKNTAANDHFGVTIAQSTLAGLFVGANRTGVNNEGMVYNYGIYYGESLLTGFETFDFPGNNTATEYYGSRVTTGNGGEVLVSSPYRTVEGNQNAGYVEFYHYEITSTDDEPLEEITEY